MREGLNFYTSVERRGGYILYRGVRGGRRVFEKHKFSPTLYIKNPNKDTGWRSLYGDPVEPIKFETMKQANSFIEQYEDVEAFSYFGMEKYEYQYIVENFRGEIAYDMSKINVVSIDIETTVPDSGFPDVEKADQEILLISLKRFGSNTVVTFATSEYTPTKTVDLLGCEVDYRCYADEPEMLRAFVNYWASDYPDIVTGWNTDEFDVPFIINRVNRVLGEDQMLKLSPWANVRERKIEIRGKEVQVYVLSGITQLDYLPVYKKFSFTPQVSYSLGLVAESEIESTKLEYTGSFKEFYSGSGDVYEEDVVPGGTLYNEYTQGRKDWEAGINSDACIVFMKRTRTKMKEAGKSDSNEFHKLNAKICKLSWCRFVEYNIRDTQLVEQIDQKRQFVEFCVQLAYMTRINFSDTLSPVRTWDVFIYSKLYDKKIAIPAHKEKKSGSIEGAYVKEPVPGMYGWNMSFDFGSLYPRIIQQWNISPETISDIWAELSVEDVLTQSQAYVDAIETARVNNKTLASNGTMYSRDKVGIIPELMGFCLDDRKVAKNAMLVEESKLQQIEAELRIRSAFAGESVYQGEISSDIKSMESHELLVNKALLQAKISALNGKQMALKTLANSGYGAMCNVGFRYFMLRMGEAVTLTGQLSNRHLANGFNEFMTKVIGEEKDYVIYCDTDSDYINVQPLVDKFFPNKSEADTINFLIESEDRFQKVINKSIDTVFEYCNCYKKTMLSKREAIASKGLWVGKKRYVLKVHNSEGVVYDPPKIKAIGLDLVKTSTPHAVRKYLKDSVSVIFDGGEKALQEYVRGVKTKFMGLPPEDVAFPRSVSDIKKYTCNSNSEYVKYVKGTPINCRAAINYNTALHRHKVGGKFQEISNGDKIKYIYLKMPNVIRENVFACHSSGKFPTHELGLAKFYDYETQFEKTFLAPLQGMTNPLGWSLEERSTLDEFFS